MDDLISRQDAIDALWKALHDYEDKTEKQFLESEELNTDDWFSHRIFVQNMSDIDRQTIIDLPSAQQWIPCSERLPEEDSFYNTHGYNKSSKYVLVTVLLYENSFGFPKIVRVGRYDYKYKKWAVLSCPQWHEIIAWMPLPIPYKESEDKE